MMISKIQKIREALGNSNTRWALTGSAAMWYHAMLAGVRPRVPEDIDIAVSPDFMDEAVARLVSSGWKKDILGSRKTHVVLTKGERRTIDVFVAGGDLAPSMRHRVKYPGLPALMSLNSLYKRKKNINLPRNKNINNTNVLRRLGGKTPSKSPVKSPVRRRLSPQIRKLSFDN